MSELDELFRGGLGDRKPEVPKDLWEKIAARRSALPDGEELDRLFADKLANRQPAVPAGMWQRIMAARRRTPLLRYAVLALLLVGMVTAGWWTLSQQAGDSETTSQPVASQAPSEPQASSVRPDPSNKSVGDATEGRATNPPETPSRNVAATPVRDKETYSPVDKATVPTFASTPVAPPAERATKSVAGVPTILNDRVDRLTNDLLADLPPAGPGGSFQSAGRNRFQAEFLTGAAYAHQRFGQSGEDARELRNAREVSEFPQLSYQLSARLDYRLHSRLHLLSGLTYVDIRNQLEYEIMRSGGKELIRSTNHVRMLEAPLLASYVISGRRLRLNLNAGPVFNLFTAVSGEYLHPDFAEPRELHADYRSNIGVGWTTSLTTVYHIGKARNLQVLLEPFFKYYPGSFTHGDAPLSERYWLAGLQLGVRKSF
ncbi:hypothetical protein [Lewinella sp. IMCC34191]|uniref:hypothetical protein n=1 Tax=Lewinella sp. IMCC34191 TaxID=2259172 RepID=UPI000E2353D0|nr:hypothetical protein [Lewinella sp. IMCC34191]